MKKKEKTKLLSWKSVQEKRPAKLNLRGLNLSYSRAKREGQLRLW